MASILLHVCCGPCSLMPIKLLREEGFDVTAFFFNPNIHPQEEYHLRLEAMQQAAAMLHVPLLTQGVAVEPQDWVTALTDLAEGVRCRPCYRVRLEATALLARERGFASFSTSLLYSRYQHHDAIIDEAKAAAQKSGTVEFLYRDFRPYWQAGIDNSKEMGLYRQKWCGCILSKGEAERQREQMQEKRRLAKEPRRAPHSPENLAG